MLTNRLTSAYLYLFLFIVAFPCLVWGIYSLCSKKSVTFTGRATVKYHRTWLERGRKNLVGFELNDGSILELHTLRADYETLLHGQSGLLTWEQDQFRHFDPDIPQGRRNRI